MAFHDKHGQFEIWTLPGEKLSDPFHAACTCACGKRVEGRAANGFSDWTMMRDHGWFIVGKAVYCSRTCAVTHDRPGVERVASTINQNIESACKALIEWDKTLTSVSSSE